MLLMLWSLILQRKHISPHKKQDYPKYAESSYLFTQEDESKHCYKKYCKGLQGRGVSAFYPLQAFIIKDDSNAHCKAYKYLIDVCKAQRRIEESDYYYNNCCHKEPVEDNHS